MKLRAVRRYVDRYTKKIVEKGAFVEVDEGRAGELMRECVATPEANPSKKRVRQKQAPE